MADPPPTDPVPALDAWLAALDGEETAARVDALNALAEAVLWTDRERCVALATEARALGSRLGYAPGRATATVTLAWALHAGNRPVDALPLFLEAEPDEGLLSEERAVGLQNGLASVYTSLGDFEGVFRTLTPLLDRVRASGDAVSEAWALLSLSTAASDLGDAENGLALGADALAAFEALGDDRGVVEARTAMGTAGQLLGRYDEARAHHEAALALARERGYETAEARALHDLAALARAEGRPEEALPLLDAALRQRRAGGRQKGVASSLLELGQSLLALGRTDEAVQAMEAALAEAEALGARLHASRALAALADAHEARGDATAALLHLRRHLAVREELIGRETAARLRAAEAQAEARRAHEDADRERRHAAEVAAKNGELEALLGELHRTQARLVQSEKVASLGRLTAGIAHELKNPLNFVTNFAGLSAELVGELEAEADPDTRRAILDDLRANVRAVETHGRRADAIVTSMMAHARGGTGEPRPTDLAALVRQSAEAARQARGADGAAAVAFDLDDVGKVVLVPEEVGRAIAALVDNALQAVAGVEGAAPRVTVGVRRRPDAVEVSVEDDGPGMTDEVRARAFEPFFTTRPTGEGTGLGLSLAWDVATGHGGSLTAGPAVRGGERLVLVLPLR